MTMIFGIIAESGIVLASDTRCMVGSSGNYVGYHDLARKIAVSPTNAQALIACAIACSSKFSAGESPITSADKLLFNPRFDNSTSLQIIHPQFERKFKNINSELKSCFSIVSIFAKYEGACPCLSFGDLKNSIVVKSNSGVFSNLNISDNNFETCLPELKDVTEFIKDQILLNSKLNTSIGPKLDIVHISKKGIEWIEREAKPRLSIFAKELYTEYQKDPSLITPTYDRSLLEVWLKEKSSSPW